MRRIFSVTSLLLLVAIACALSCTGAQDVTRQASQQMFSQIVPGGSVDRVRGEFDGAALVAEEVELITEEVADQPELRGLVDELDEEAGTITLMGASFVLAEGVELKGGIDTLADAVDRRVKLLGQVDDGVLVITEINGTGHDQERIENGSVESADEEAGTFTVLGITVLVTAETLVEVDGSPIN